MTTKMAKTVTRRVETAKNELKMLIPDAPNHELRSRLESAVTRLEDALSVWTQAAKLFEEAVNEFAEAASELEALREAHLRYKKEWQKEDTT